MLLYSSVLPSFDTDSSDDSELLYDASLDASNPDNFNDSEDLIIVKA